MSKAAAFFDLDRTLIAGASLFPVGVEAWRQGLAEDMDVAKWALSAAYFVTVGDKGGDTSEEVRSDLLGQIAGASAESVDALGTAVLPRLKEKVRPEAAALVEMHHDAGRDTWIVSASPQTVVEPLAVALGMTGAVATKGEIIDGIYTGELDGPFVYGDGKTQAIKQLVTERGYDLSLCYAYSDSVSDLPMLELVGHPVAVNPDSELAAVARERGWPRVVFARKAKRAIKYGGVGSGTIAAALIAYVLGRRHGRAAALAQIGKEKIGG